MTDAQILDSTLIIDDHWWLGMTYGEQLVLNADICGSDLACLGCWDAISEYVYRIVH
jgi:hypothetical protein